MISNPTHNCIRWRVREEMDKTQKLNKMNFVIEFPNGKWIVRYHKINLTSNSYHNQCLLVQVQYNKDLDISLGMAYLLTFPYM